MTVTLRGSGSPACAMAASTITTVRPTAVSGVSTGATPVRARQQQPGHRQQLAAGILDVDTDILSSVRLAEPVDEVSDQRESDLAACAELVE